MGVPCAVGTGRAVGTGCAVGRGVDNGAAVLVGILAVGAGEDGRDSVRVADGRATVGVGEL